MSINVPNKREAKITKLVTCLLISVCRRREDASPQYWVKDMESHELP